MAQFNISNRTATAGLTAGQQYTLSNISYPGYDTSTFNPSTITPEDPAVAANVTVQANGVLELTVKNASGTPVDLTGATITRVDSLGTELSVIAAFTSTAIVPDPNQTTNTGKVTINFLPWHATTAPDVYIKVEATGYDAATHSYKLTTENTNVEDFEITRTVQQTINFSDAVYTGALPTTDATIDIA